MTDLITTNNDLVKRNFELTLAEASDDDLTNAHENVAMVLSMVKAEQLRRVRVLWEAHNAEMDEKHAANLERYRWFKATFTNPDEGQTSNANTGRSGVGSSGLSVLNTLAPTRCTTSRAMICGRSPSTRS